MIWYSKAIGIKRASRWHTASDFLRKVSGRARRYSVRQVIRMSGELCEISKVNEWLPWPSPWYELVTPQIHFVACNWLLEFWIAVGVATAVCKALGERRVPGIQGRLEGK
jgi:hypothetical protein